MGVKERKAREKERRRQQIVVAAKRVFSKKGYARARMEDIANEAELAPATLYIYFRNKEELFASFSLALLQYLSAKLKSIATEPDTSPVTKLVQLRNALYEIYMFDPWGMGSMLLVQSGEMLSNLSPGFLKEFRQLLQYANRLLKSVFEEGITQGVLVDRHPMAMVNIFWSTLTGVLLTEKNRQLLDGHADRFKETFDFAFDILQRGLTKPHMDQDVHDKICCQCAIKSDCTGLRDLFRPVERNCPDLVAMNDDPPVVGMIEPALCDDTGRGMMSRIG